jgi:hypothetical protein
MRAQTGGSEYVFVNPFTNQRHVDIKHAFHSAWSAAEIAGLGHTFASRLAKRGIDLILVK